MRDRRSVALLAAFVALLYSPFFHGHFFGTDELTVYETTRAIYEHGNLVVPPSRHVFRGRDGESHGHFAIGQSVLALPLYALGRLAHQVLPEPWLIAIRGRAPRGATIDSLGSTEIFAVALYGLLSSAALVSLFFAFERRLGASLESSLAASLVLGISTQVAMMSVYFLQHTTEALMILGALYCLVGWKQQGRVALLAAGSLLASLSLLVRVPAIVALPPIMGYALWVLWSREGGRLRCTWSEAVAALLPGVGVLALHVALNRALWGTWFASPMVDQSEFFHPSRIHVGLFGFLLSPGASIFLYSPPLLLLPTTFRSFWTRHRPEALTILASSLCLLLFCSSFDSWTGLWSSPGPRYLFAAVPLLMLPLGPWLDAGGRWQWRQLAAVAALGAVIQGVLMAARWTAVIAIMQFENFAPENRFVFLPDFTPIEGSVRAIAAGEIDAWLWGLWRGWDGEPGRPVAALALALAWAILVGLCARALRRELAPAAEDRALRQDAPGARRTRAGARRRTR